MKLHIISDLHNEFSKYHIQVKDADVVILAGDIGVGTQGFQYAKSLLLETSSRILYVPGNHEYYGYHIDLMRYEMRQLFKEAAIDRLFFMDCDEVVIDGVRFLGTTMWTDFKLFGEARRHECLMEARWLNDFRIIKYGNGDVFRARDSVEVFNHSVDWLTKKLAQPFNGKTVVITHHLPSFDSVVERYRDDILSACFASNLDYLFGKCDLWVTMYQITDENGERMPLVESLFGFIKDNQDSVFITGRWLNTLSTEVLEDLTLQTEQFTFSTILIAKEAYIAEMRHPIVEFEMEEMFRIYEALTASIQFELIRRTGLITFESELSVIPKKTIQFRLTEMGEKIKRSKES